MSAFPTVASAPPLPIPAARGPRVLVVEDNPLVLEVFVSFLERQGCECFAAPTGAAAAELAQSRQPDVVLMDLVLPDGDGVGFLPALKTACPRARFIGVSAHQGTSDRQRGLDAGLEAFLAKPVELAALWRAVKGEAGPVATVVSSPLSRLRARFHQELPAQRSALSAALAAGDLRRLVSLAHYLRNSAIVVELPALLALATQLETAARRGDASATAEAWQRCDAALGELAAHPVS